MCVSRASDGPVIIKAKKNRENYHAQQGSPANHPSKTDTRFPFPLSNHGTFFFQMNLLLPEN